MFAIASGLRERRRSLHHARMIRPTVFDCFCGLGGLSIGAELAGFEIVGGVDADEEAVEMYGRIFPGKHALNQNLLQVRPRAVLREAGIARGDVDVLVGGPPCQPYSINNHQRGTHDARCALVDSYLEFVSTLQPRWLVIENVPGFAAIESGSFLKRLLRALRVRRYSPQFLFLQATQFGVPQRRKRLVIIAGTNAMKVSRVVRSLSQKAGEALTVGEAFADLPVKTAEKLPYVGAAVNRFQRTMRRRKMATVQGHVASSLGEKNLERIQYVLPGGNWRDIPRRLLPSGMKRARLSDHTTRYGRLRADRPSFTLLTKCDPHWGCFVHPTADRVITVREAARLQSIPDHVEFTGTLTANYRFIGNAVPPLLAQGILEHLS